MKEDDAISRQAVHEAITRWAGSISVFTALPTREVRPLLDSIHELPSVNPQEPKAGHWIAIDEEPHEDYECDRCGFIYTLFSFFNGPTSLYNFCPNCGAKMEDSNGRK